MKQLEHVIRDTFCSFLDFLTRPRDLFQQIPKLQNNSGTKLYRHEQPQQYVRQEVAYTILLETTRLKMPAIKYYN